VLTHDGKSASGVQVSMEIQGRGGKTLSAVTNGAGVAAFEPKDLLGKPVAISVEGRVYKSTTLNKDYSNSHPTADIRLDPPGRGHTATPAPAGHDAHPAPAGHDAHPAPAGHDAHPPGGHEPEGVLVTVFNRGKHVYGATLYVKGKHDRVYVYDEKDDFIVVPFPPKDVTLVVSAPGYETKEVELGFDQNELRVYLESSEPAFTRPKNVDIMRLLVAVVVIAGLVFIAMNAPRQQVNLAMPAAIQLGIQAATWLVLVGSVISVVAAVADRVYRHQKQDLEWAVLALILFQFGGWDVLIGPETAGIWRYGFQAVFFVGAMFALYVSAMHGTKDFTTPGAFWLVNVAISMISGTFGPLSDWLKADGNLYTLLWLFDGLDNGLNPKFTLLVVGVALFAGFHFIADISGLFVKGEDPEEKIGSIILGAAVIAGYYLVTAFQWLPPVGALVVVSAAAALFAEAGKVGFGFIATDADQAQTSAGKAMLSTKWDGLALGPTVIIWIALVFGYV